ncbi:hypothetical protein [Kitasatospora sp. GAS204B]|uniref:hypothetical protein n=1 Tax=unclassified Kitasatospora TaxID=2633591 RepID=UPI0024732FB2|nr:hypothetical protein [Kitasatospora sp. GAS204B]MDH6122922.1 hypothetical protein [Kitasatospora sp. GAS204B]
MGAPGRASDGARAPILMSALEMVLSSLLDPLDEPQSLLVNTIWRQFEHGKRFPVYSYVGYVMGNAGHNAAAVLHSFPTVGRHLTATGYGAVGWHHQGTRIPPEAEVWLTVAGLHHVHEDVSVGVTRALLAYMRALTKAQEEILRHPFEVLNLNMNLTEAVQRSGDDGGTFYVPWATAVAEHEWPGLSFSRAAATDTGNGALGYLTAADFHTTDAYLAAVAAALTQPEPLATLPYGEPRALLRAANFLDVTYELVAGASLVERPPMDRSSLLALPVASEADFHAGVTVLAELLGKLKVPGKNPSHALGRLEQHLVDTLPAIDRAVVHDAVHTLDQIRLLRNSTIHTKPAPDLLQAHEDLGLTFPINDFATAWDSVRAHAEQAFAILQEAIQAART